jgi:AraC family transcriptional regulator
MARLAMTTSWTGTKDRLPGQKLRPRALVVGEDRVELLPSAPYDANYIAEAPMVGFAFETQSGVHSFASDRVTAFRSRPNSLAYVPAGCDVFSSSSRGGEYLAITGGSGYWPKAQSTLRFSDHIDPTAIAAARMLRRMILMSDAVEPLEIDRQLSTLQEIVSQVLNGGETEPLAARWMTPRRLELVDDLVEASPESGVTVPEIAARLDLSVGFFNRAFKAAVGATPHDYVIDRRVSRARRLLWTTNLSLADIAAACGFASHSHMTVQLRSRLGVTPSALRNGV